MRDDWQLKALGDVLKLEYGKPLPEEDRTADGIYPAYGANGIYCRTNKSYHEKPSIIVGRKGSAGELTLTDGGFWPLDVTYYVTYDDRLYDLKFLYYALSSLELTRLAKGVKPGINRNDVYDIKFSFPVLYVQRCIVAILDEAFAGIAAATANAEKNLANAHELFEEQHSNTFYQNADDWCESKLGRIATFKNGLNFTKSSEGDLVNIVGVKDFQKNFWVPVENLETVQIDAKLGDEYTLRDGDILTVRSNGNKRLIGRCLLAKSTPAQTSHSGFTIRIRLSSCAVTPEYLVHFLKSKTSRQKLVEIGDGTNITSLNQKGLSELPVRFPSLAEQEEIVLKIETLASQAERLVSVYHAKLKTISELKQTLLQTAFSGELTALPEKVLQEEAA